MYYITKQKNNWLSDLITDPLILSGLNTLGSYSSVSVKSNTSEEGDKTLWFAVPGFTKSDLSITYLENHRGFNIKGEIEDKERSKKTDIKTFKYFIDWGYDFKNTKVETSVENGILEIKLSRVKKEPVEIKIM